MLKKIDLLDLLIKLIFFGGLMLSPFIFWPRALIQYEIPRVWFVLLWIDCLLILGLIRFIFKPFQLKGDTASLKLLLFYLLTTIIASCLGMDLSKSIYGNFYRGDGLITLLHLFGIWFFIVLFWKKTWKKLFVFIMALQTLLISFWAVITSIKLNWNLDSWYYEVGLIFGQPNFLAGFLVVTLPFYIYLITISRKKYLKIFWFLAILVQFLAILSTKSWGGILGIILFIILSMLTTFFSTKPGLVILTTISGTILLLLICWFYWSRVNFIPQELLAESRFRIYIKAWLAFQQKPLLGWGYANFDYAFSSIDWPYHFDLDAYVDKAHNLFLEILVTTGIFGLISYLAFIIYSLLKLYQKAKMSTSQGQFAKTLLLIIMLYLFHSQTNVISVAEEMMFWITSGMAMNES